MAIRLSGKFAVTTAAEHERKFHELYILYQNLGSMEFVMKYCEASHVSIKIMKRPEMDQMFGQKHGGVVAMVEEYEYVNLYDILKQTDSPFIVILDGLEDPHNLGAVLRTAEATGVDCVVIPKHHSVGLNDTVAKVAVGAMDLVPVAQVTNITKTIQELKKLGLWIVGLEADSPLTYTDIDGNMRIAIVIGSEGKGMSRLVKEQCDFLASIPMKGSINSLNASVSAALMMYHVFLQRQ
jgi:23S rRNA (guanosine2251-2'-O)-methyltransferase